MEIRGQSWCSEARFSSFWNHYDAVEQWRKSHTSLVNAAIKLGSKNEACNVLPSISRTVTKENTLSNSLYSSREAVYEEDEPMDISQSDVDEEYLEFRRKTLEHRRQRDEKRAEKKNGEKKEDDKHWIILNEDDYIEADKLGINGPEKRTLNAPDEQAKNEQRRKQAKELYGEAADKILAMETALDMRFIEEHRRKHPPMWPNIPLKF